MKRSDQVGLVLVLEAGIPATRRNRIRSRLQELGASVTYVEGGGRAYLEVRGDDAAVRTLGVESWEGVDQMVPLSSSTPHATWGDADSGPCSPTVVQIGSGDQRVTCGGGHFALMAGPCAVESEQGALRLAREISSAGAAVFRAGAFKPRTSPYAFQGLEEEGLRILAEVRRRVGVPIITEVMSTEHVEMVAEVADMLQVGSRSMQNFPLLKRLGRDRRPVLLKRGFSATVDEWLNAAEYLLSAGNDQVILCERGIRSAAGSDSVVLDLGVIPELRRRTHLPVIVDPSHGSRAAHRVAPLARAAVAAGADGLLVEVHDAPEEALSDGRQALRPAQLQRLIQEITAIRTALGYASEPSVSGPVATPAGKE